MRDTVLVITDESDYTADLVISGLSDRGIKVVRFDPGAGPVRMEAELDGSGWRGYVGGEHRVFDPTNVLSVLWRWPTRIAGHPEIADEAHRTWVAREDASALLGVLKAMPVRKVSSQVRQVLSV